ncbi:MAG TPA: ATP-binding cassette domain-containing protein [Gammaproteobacteria bacterium]
MTILSFNDVSLAYGHHPLLAHVNFQVSPGERVCLVGRNGTGKSTLFRVITGVAQPDDGEVWRKDTLRVSHLEQEVPEGISGTVYDVVAAGLGETGRLLREYHHALHHVDDSGAAAMAQLSSLQHKIEVLDGWNINQKVETVLSRLSLPADKPVADCSGGIRRRVLLAQALVSDPDLLLLDEPTNHMDITAINWLEEYLLGFQGALIFITHDRTFLKHLATRIIELDRGRLTSFPGNYDDYLRKKEEMLEIEARADARFDKQLAEQEAWIRQGIKARRTRNEGRVRALLAMRRQRSERIGVQGKANLEVDAGEMSGKLVADLRHVSFRYGDGYIVRDLSLRIMRGDRIGIIGPNGSGKSTLLKLILGDIKPDTGRVVMGTRMQMAYFDQHRGQLDPEKTVRENLSEGRDYISIKGRDRHVVGYLRDFLFPPERIDSPVKALSGGERNRLLLARIFAQPANMMVLDEPTNDLDVDTLELLEDLLAEYEGTLLLVSHDRTFLDNIVTSTLVFEGDGRIGEYAGGYEDWLRQKKSSGDAAKPGVDEVEKALHKTDRENITLSRRKKLSYNESRELVELPDRIETLELERQQIEQKMGQGDFYQQDKNAITATLGRLKQLREELDHAYQRWEYLLSIQ